MTVNYSVQIAITIASLILSILEWKQRPRSIKRLVLIMIIFSGGLITISLTLYQDTIAETKIENLENQVSALSPRELTGRQRSILSEELAKRKESKVGFIVKIHDLESKDYAEELLETFKLAGWQIMPSRYDLLDDFSGKINIFMTGQKKGEGVNISLVSTFTPFDRAGIEYQSEIPRVASFAGGVEENTLYIEVGAKK